MKHKSNGGTTPPVIERAIHWIDGQFDDRRGGFRFSPESPVCLLGTACAVLAAETLGALPWWTKDRRASSLALLHRHQREDGWFEDPCLRPTPGKNLDRDYLLGHATFLAVMALDALEERPLQPLSFLDRWRTEEDVYEFIQRLDWTQPWRESNWVEWIGYWLLAEAGVTSNDVPLRESELPAGVRGLLRWLDDHQDPVTGFWGKPRYSGQDRVLHLVAGGYHHFVFYYAMGRPIRYHRQIVDLTLGLQQPDGLFAPGRVGGGPCEDLDAVDILVNLHRLEDYRRDEIKIALTRAAEALAANQRRDGAFVHFVGSDGKRSWRDAARIVLRPSLRPAPRTRLIQARNHLAHARVGSRMHYGGCPALPYHARGGDMFSQWFRPLALGLAGQVIGTDRSPFRWTCGFRRQITQGWLPGAPGVRTNMSVA